MPLAEVTWLGLPPDRSMLEELFRQVTSMTSEERDEFLVTASHWPTCLESKKVIICGSQVFVGTIANEILSLVPDDALNIACLIWMWDAEPITIDEITLENIQQAMSL